MQYHIQKCAEAATQHIDCLLKDENEPFTMNDRYYAEYRSKFLGHYKKDRLRSTNSVIQNLEDNNSPGIKTAVNEAMSSLARLGFRSIDASSLVALLPPDPMEPAIGIMADVRAYFQGQEHLVYLLLSESWLTPRYSCLQALHRQCSHGHRPNVASGGDGRPRDDASRWTRHQWSYSVRALQEASERARRYS